MKRVTSFVDHLDIRNVSVAMTLILVLLYTGDQWYLKMPIILLVSAGVVFEDVRRSSTFWLSISALLLFTALTNWYYQDNHKYLISYWCLAIFFSCLSANPQKVLAKNARLLIGLTFLFAVIWKIIAPDYINGDFFKYTFLTDQRLASAAVFIGGLELEQLEANRNARQFMADVPVPDQDIKVQSTPGVDVLAIITTWWVLIIESLVAIAFLSREQWLISYYRDVIFIVFIITTFSVAPVIGFGLVLTIMGFAQSDKEHPRTVMSYFLLFFLVQALDLPSYDILTAIGL